MNFRVKTILGIALIESVLLVVLVLSSLDFLRTSNEEQLSQRAANTSHLFASATKNAVLATDLATLESFVEGVLSNPQFVYIRIYGGDQVLAEGGPSEFLTGKRSPDSNLESVSDGVYDVLTPIEEAGITYGSIEFGLSTRSIQSVFAQARQWAISIAALEVFLVAIFSWILGTYLTRYLRKLQTASKTIEESGPGHQLMVTGQDEIAEVSKAFNTMSSSLQRTYSELKDSLAAREKMLVNLERNRAKSQAILSASLDAIITIDQNDKVIDFNEAAESIFGWQFDEIVGKDMSDHIIPAEMREAHDRGMKHYLATGEGPVLNSRIQLQALNKDGRQFPVEVAICPIDTPDGKLFTAFLRDISEQKANEEQLLQAIQQSRQADEAKGRFLAVMSHEIRTPMNAVLGVLGLLRETPLDENQQDLIKTGRDSGEMLLSIINDILDFSKMEAGKLELESTNFDLHRLLNQSMALLKPLAQQHNLELHITLSDDLPRFLRGDSGRLQQVLVNLINNACKFTLHGSIALRASAVFLADNKFELHCELQDTGIGIPQDRQNELFAEFSMVDQSHSRAYEGTGLGLAICKRLVSLMGGQIAVKSQPEVGSCFYFQVIMEIVGAGDIEMTQELKPFEHPNPTTRILLTEDNPANQRVIRAILRNAGLQVDLASNGQEAVEAVAKLPYDIVLMDISMPRMDGMEATRTIRKMSGARGQVPIVALTAHALKGDRQRFIDSGMNDYLTKPIDKSATLRCIHRWTSGQSNQDTAVDLQQIEPASPQADDGPVTYVDEAVIQQLVRDTSADIVPELLLGYIEDTHERLRQIKEAVSHADAGKLELEVHTLGSSAGAHGNTVLLELARDIEGLCRQGDSEAAIERTAELFALAEESLRQLAERTEAGFE